MFYSFVFIFMVIFVFMYGKGLNLLKLKFKFTSVQGLNSSVVEVRIELCRNNKGPNSLGPNFSHNVISTCYICCY